MAHTDHHSVSPLARRSPSLQLTVVGVNHKTATAAERTAMQIGREEMARFEARLFAQPGVIESAIVATCNRIEFYLVADKSVSAWETVVQLYRELTQSDISELHSHKYELSERTAAEHLFRVAAGADSMVLGETQILGQVKDAFSSACQLKTVGKVLQRLFHQAFRVGKLARTDTSLGKGACSVSSAAVALLESRLAAFDRPELLFVGAGKMISLAATRCGALPFKHITFTNRTSGKARALASTLGCRAVPWEELPDHLVASDIVISCTGAPVAVITEAMLDRVSRRRAGRPLLLLDLAIPADIEWQDGRYDSIDRLGLDDIQAFAERNQADRAAELPKIEAIVTQRLDEFMYWYTHVHRELTRSSLRDALETVRQQELKQVLAKLPLDLQTELTDASRHLVEKLMQIHLRVNPPADKGA